MRSKFPTLLIVMTMTIMVPFCGILPGCTGADNPKVKEVPNLEELASKVKPEPTTIKGKTVDFEKKPKYMDAMGKRNKTGP